MEGIDVNEKDNDGDTALTKASRSGQFQIVQELLKMEGIDVNEKNNYGKTARALAERTSSNCSVAHISIRSYSMSTFLSYSSPHTCTYK